MTYETYRQIFQYAAIASGVMLAVSIVLFFWLRIPSVISDLTGRTARKAIDEIRKQNESTGDKVYRSSPVNRARGKLTDKITPSGNLISRGETPFAPGAMTEKINTQILEEQNRSRETTILSGETDVLESGNETAVLTQTGGATTVLCEEQYAPAETVEEAKFEGFEIEFERTFISSEEEI